MAPIRWQRKTTNDKLLLMNTLQLQPVATAAVRILARSSLGNDPFQMHLACLLKYRLSIRFNVLPKPQMLPRTAYDLLQHFLPLNQPQIPRRMTIQMKQVEYEVSERLPHSLLKRCLQIRKAGHPILRKHHDLAIKNRLLYRQRRNKRSDGLHPMCPVQAGTRQQLDLPSIFARLDAIAI